MWIFFSILDNSLVKYFFIIILQGDRHFIKLSRIFRCVQMQRRIIHEPREEMRSLVNTSELRKERMGLWSNNQWTYLFFYERIDVLVCFIVCNRDQLLLFQYFSLSSSRRVMRIKQSSNTNTSQLVAFISSHKDIFFK